MAGIDQKVVLGLAGKVQQVFGKPGAYLSFPASPFGFEADSLRSLITDPLSKEGSTAHAEFSHLVNEIPDGPYWQPDGDRLWDVYGDLLSPAVVELIEQPRSESERDAYDDALKLLYDDGPDDIPEPSQAVIAYEQYRDAYLAASIEYRNRQGEAELSTDDAVKAAWTADEPTLHAAVDEAEADWAGPGRRDEIEAARRVVASYGSRSPAVVWEQFRKLFDPTMPELYFRTTADGLPYVPTGYLPGDVVDVSWPQITVAADELEALAKDAPDELRSRLSGGADSGVDLVTFEYTLVTVSRSWLNRDLFGSRAWEFRDPDRKLSDGATPPKGECTAYVTGLVLARNITVRRKADSGSAEVDLGFLPTKLKAAPYLAPRYTVRDHRTRTRDRRTAGTRTRDRRTVRVRTRDHRTAPARPSALSTAVLSLRASKLPLVRARPARPADSTGTRTERVRATRSARRSTTPSTATTTTTDPNEIFVLAFECCLLPESPNPERVEPRPDENRPEENRPDENGPETYTVVSGDTLAKIARRFYDDTDAWRRIYDANRATIGDDPGRIKPGQTLTIPMGESS